ncbi:RNA polymerase III transcription factor IIIC subunit-domain-containing protein [Phyllosticta citricarpa]|uniref:RNA polymerase III transcription factor IIIC subunit-domain-containing protein n=2 Tax=Phyllosticta TaxID=121621 RepID=A0ABR1MP20_9PEZI
MDDDQQLLDGIYDSDGDAALQPTPSAAHHGPADASAPALAVPRDHVVSLEHPCIVKNIDNGLKSLGGSVVVDKFLQTRNRQKTIGASLRPGDVMAKPVMSNFVKTRNILIKVTVPKRTGRKRKRGSDDPWIDDPRPHDAAHTDPLLLLQSLRDNPDNYSVQAVGINHETHRFRSLPDFQYATSQLPLAQTLRDTILPYQYSKLKHFKLDNHRDNDQPDQGVGPSPQFTGIDVPYNYSYRQNPAVKHIQDDKGREITYNPTAGRKFILHTISIDAKKVPHESPVPLPPEETLEPHVRETIANIRALLEQRPIMTKRYLHNNIQAPTDDSIRSSYGYVGYSFNSGPWRDTLIRFGVDPRTDPKYRVYQTVMFKIPITQGKESSEDPNKWMDSRVVYRREGRQKGSKKLTHMFDGKKLVPDGKVWQVCDITDPQLRRILDTNKLRKTCNIKSDGWFLNGTWAKIKVLMREKIGVIIKGNLPRDEDYTRIELFPDAITAENLAEISVGRRRATSEYETKLAGDIRNLAKAKVSKLEPDDIAALPQADGADDDEDTQDDVIPREESGADSQKKSTGEPTAGRAKAAADGSDEDASDASGASADDDGDSDAEDDVDDLMGPDYSDEDQMAADGEQDGDDE